jgi:hypothetical protein
VRFEIRLDNDILKTADHSAHGKPATSRKNARMRGYPELMGILSGFSAAISLIITHILTIYTAFSHGAGLGGIFLTTLLPIASEIYWVFHIWRATGSFMNALTGLCIISVLLAASTYAFSIASREAT